MKILPKQSVCPHCKTVYRYSDLKKIMWKKSDSCYHCKKNFKVSRKGIARESLEVFEGTIFYHLVAHLGFGSITQSRVVVQQVDE